MTGQELKGKIEALGFDTEVVKDGNGIHVLYVVSNRVRCAFIAELANVPWFNPWARNLENVRKHREKLEELMMDFAKTEIEQRGSFL